MACCATKITLPPNARTTITRTIPDQTPQRDYFPVHTRDIQTVERHTPTIQCGIKMGNSQRSTLPQCNGRASPWVNHLPDHGVSPA
ncbi:hypothetical protein D4764_0131880, partial [Takifugu flavidus]